MSLLKTHSSENCGFGVFYLFMGHFSEDGGRTSKIINKYKYNKYKIKIIIINKEIKLKITFFFVQTVMNQWQAKKCS